MKINVIEKIGFVRSKRFHFPQRAQYFGTCKYVVNLVKEKLFLHSIQSAHIIKEYPAHAFQKHNMKSLAKKYQYPKFI